MTYDPNNPPWAQSTTQPASGATPDPTAPTPFDPNAAAPVGAFNSAGQTAAPADGTSAVEPRPEVPTPAAKPTLSVGQIVAHHYFDPYNGPGGEERVVLGLVLDVTDTGARIVFLPAASDPVPFNELEALT